MHSVDLCLTNYSLENVISTSRTALAAKRVSPLLEIWTRHGSSHPFVIHRSSVGRATPSASASSFCWRAGCRLPSDSARPCARPASSRSGGGLRRHPSASAHTVRKPIRAGSTDRIRQTPAAVAAPGRVSRSTPARRPGSLFFGGAAWLAISFCTVSLMGMFRHIGIFSFQQPFGNHDRDGSVFQVSQTFPYFVSYGFQWFKINTRVQNSCV